MLRHMALRLAGGYEYIYNNTPPHRLGAAATLVPAAGARRPPRVAQGFATRPTHAAAPPTGSRSDRTPPAVPTGHRDRRSFRFPRQEGLIEDRKAGAILRATEARRRRRRAA